MTRTFSHCFSACAGPPRWRVRARIRFRPKDRRAIPKRIPSPRLHDSLVLEHRRSCFDASKATPEFGAERCRWMDRCECHHMKTAWVRAVGLRADRGRPWVDFSRPSMHSIDARIEGLRQGQRIRQYMLMTRTSPVPMPRRIIYARTRPDFIKSRESDLHYTPAAWPATDAEAADFKNKLCRQDRGDAQTLSRSNGPEKTDIAEAPSTGLVALIETSKEEKVNNASLSRRIRATPSGPWPICADNLNGDEEGPTALFQRLAFPAIEQGSPRTASRRRKDLAGFQSRQHPRHGQDRSRVPEARHSQPPASWSAENPSAADLATQLWPALQRACSPRGQGRPNSVVSQNERRAAYPRLPTFVP